MAPTDPANPGIAADGGTSGEDEVAAKMKAEQEQGFRGAEVDPTPDEAYTVAGVTSGAATPETDAGAAKAAREAAHLGSDKFAPSGPHDEAIASESSESEPAEEKLTGDALDERLEELEIDGSTGGSNADGSMNADEKRAAIAEAEAAAGME